MSGLADSSAGAVAVVADSAAPAGADADVGAAVFRHPARGQAAAAAARTNENVLRQLTAAL